MSMAELHRMYLRRRFELDVDDAVFSGRELTLLSKYGQWLTALENGLIQPTTDEQRRFLDVMKEVAEPANEIERAWLKYRLRKTALAEAERVPHYNLVDERDAWYSEDAYGRGIHFPRRQR